MKKIKWLSTGGTISCVNTENGLSPAAAENQMRAMTAAIPETGAEIFPECLMNLDSTDISADDMKKIGLAAHNAITDGFDGIVITHGTDTMAYTAAVLRKMLSNSPVPIIITGSQRPFFAEDSDGKSNLYNAFKAAQMNELSDVYLLFGDKIILGGLAHKEYTRSDNAFVSTGEYSGRIENGVVTLGRLPEKFGEYKFTADFDEKVMLVKLTPLTDGNVFAYAAENGIRGIVIEGYGMGGIPSRLLPEIKSAYDKGIKIMLISQCLYESIDMSIYEVGVNAKKLGIISGGDMCAEAAVAEIMFMLGNNY